LTSQRVTVPSTVAPQNANPLGRNVLGNVLISRGKPCTNVWRTIPVFKLYTSYPPRLAVDIWSLFGESELPSLINKGDENLHDFLSITVTHMGDGMLIDWTTDIFSTSHNLVCLQI
jgi:hypothetical protein